MNDDVLNEQPNAPAQDMPIDATKSPFPTDLLPDLREKNEQTPHRSREEFTTVYDIIDRLEDQLNAAKGSMFSANQIKINREEFMNELSSLKDTLPVQLERASALMREAERRLLGAQQQAATIVSSAQGQAKQIIAEAQEQAQFLVGQENVTQLAREKANSMIETAMQSSAKLTNGADAYCMNMMQSLQEQLEHFDHDISKGIQILQERQAQARAQMPQLGEDDYPEE